MKHGKQLRLLLTSGDARGIRYAELVNWTGQAVTCPKNLLPDLKAWAEEVERPGVYILFGLDEKAQAIAYIGESEDVLSRLNTHRSNPPFSEIVEVLLFTSKDQNLTKGHITFLEEKLATKAKDAGQIPIQEGRTPDEKTLSRSERATMEEFLDNIYLVAAALGYKIFETTEKISTSGVVYEIKIRQGADEGLIAKGQPVADGFLVLKGSHATKADGSIPSGYAIDKETLKLTGGLVEDGKFLKFTRDYLFNTPTPAACIITGSRRSGPSTWICPSTNKTLGETE